MILPLILVAFIVVKGPTLILFSTGAWQTQTILYQIEDLKFNMVELQMQDNGAMGYHKRTVEVVYLTNLFIIVKEVPDNIDKRAEWIRVNEDINELGLKFP